MRHLVDTDVLVDHITKMPGAANHVDSLGTLSYSIITAMELLAGAENKKEIRGLGNFSEISSRTSSRSTSGRKDAR